MATLGVSRSILYGKTRTNENTRGSVRESRIAFYSRKHGIHASVTFGVTHFTRVLPSKSEIDYDAKSIIFHLFQLLVCFLVVNFIDGGDHVLVLMKT